MSRKAKKNEVLATLAAHSFRFSARCSQISVQPAPSSTPSRWESSASSSSSIGSGLQSWACAMNDSWKAERISGASDAKDTRAHPSRTMVPLSRIVRRLVVRRASADSGVLAPIRTRSRVGVGLRTLGTPDRRQFELRCRQRGHEGRALGSCSRDREMASSAGKCGVIRNGLARTWMARLDVGSRKCRKTGFETPSGSSRASRSGRPDCDFGYHLPSQGVDFFFQPAEALVER